LFGDGLFFAVLFVVANEVVPKVGIAFDIGNLELAQEVLFGLLLFYGQQPNNQLVQPTLSINTLHRLDWLLAKPALASALARISSKSISSNDVLPVVPLNSSSAYNQYSSY
jgi:hypothetical protein